MNKTFKSDNGCTAQVVQHSISPEGKEIITFNVKYALIVHAEALRHRQLSRGVKSNRAIPPHKIRAEVMNDPYVPVWFGANQRGMVANVQVKYPKLARKAWLAARLAAVGAHWVCDKVFGGHKEWVNRLLNPWQWVRETITATEWDNFYNLRVHPDAQKDIQDIAALMYRAQQASSPMPINAGEWHVPYVDRAYNIDRVVRYFDNDGQILTADEAIKCSAARCARSSYDNHDKTTPTLETDLPLYDMLIESNPKHSSPIEHSATPMLNPTAGECGNSVFPDQWEEGTTHMDKYESFWSGNFKGYVQYRQLLSNHVCNNYQAGEKDTTIAK